MATARFALRSDQGVCAALALVCEPSNTINRNNRQMEQLA